MTIARKPSAALVVDTNIVLSMVLGFRLRGIWDRVATRRRLLFSVESVAELMAVIWHLRDRAPDAEHDAKIVLRLIEVPPEARYRMSLVPAADALRNAPASRNGSVADAHILALAWAYEADIWSHDRDFAGTGWPSWSSANLAAALSAEAAASAANP
ncbi:PIN domain-containing protein [Bosea sp. (in: a-proteobacteria)]|uniref:PIN domain-containing protein n=1 Tax=Bosea sp. (in: a-proteobacteria) TaxID=1871050 RepID=UPI0027343674|nr:PIN domain-containing protein [Bosea sp. (in: a-proteobacteria)]MDP3409248.1 PIN domain-containing protein [Bosea sp. (in: a-proteobacteria)]